MLTEVFEDKKVWLLLAASFASVGLTALLRILGSYILHNNVLWIEGLHALLGTILSLFILVPVILVRSRISERYPYGLYKLEDLIAIILAIVILFSLFLDLGELFRPPVETGAVVALVQAASLPFLAVSAWLKRKAGFRLRSPSLVADASHVIVDVAEGGGVLAGLTLYMVLNVGWMYTATVGVALLGLLIAAYEAGHESVTAILDLPKDKRVLEEIRRAAEEALGGGGVVADIKVRWAGPAIFVEVLLNLHPLLTIEEASLIAKRVRRFIASSVEGVKDVAVRIEPVRRRNMVVAAPVMEKSHQVKLSQHFGKARYMLIADIKEGKIMASRFIENPARAEKEREGSKMLRGARVAEKLYRQGITDIIVCNIGEIAFSLLLRHHIVVWQGECDKTVGDNIRLLVEGTLRVLREPTREESWEK